MKKTPRVIIRVDAVPEIGLGHFYRCFSLAQMLNQSFDISFAISSNSAQSCFRLLEEAQFDFQLLAPFDYSTPDERGYSEMEFDLSSTLNKVDIVVLDGYWFGTRYQKELRKYPVSVAIIEDNGGGKYLADLVINHAGDLKKENFKLDSTQPLFALGTDYSLIRRGFLKTAISAKAFKTEIKTIIICFGGSDLQGLTMHVLGWFLQNTSLSLHVVAGNSNQHVESIKELLTTNSGRFRLSFNLNEEQMLAALTEADLAVVPASTILMECLACRIPAISGMAAENQSRIYNGLLSDFVFFDAGMFEEENLRYAYKQVTSESLIKMQHAQRNCIDGLSEERYQSLFLKLDQNKLMRLRRVTKDDARMLLSWANDKSVRSNAFSEETIAWEDHIEWLESKLISADTQYLILERLGEAVGQVRFDKDERGHWVIDYSIDVSYRAKGYGKIILKMSIDFLFSEYQKSVIAAIVKKNNIPSLKVFRSLGFKEVKTENVFRFYLQNN